MVCVTHYSLEYIGRLPYPIILEILDARAVMNGGKTRAQRQEAGLSPEERKQPEWMQRAMQQQMGNENRRAESKPRHITTLPLAAQRVAAQRKKALKDRE